MAYRDLREYVDLLDRDGQLLHLHGAHWEEEVGAISYLSPKAVLIDNIPGYPTGHRILANILGRDLRQFFLATNWSTESRGIALTREWKEHLRSFSPTPSIEVNEGPILENVLTGEDVDLLKFPVPKWHEEDGGRYIGTMDMVITQDPETGRLNCGSYRMQVHDRATLGIHISEGKDGYLIREKYLAQEKPCPIVAVFAVDPAQLLASGGHITHVDIASELSFSGWLKGVPEEVVRGPVTGLPIPARAEIAVEGEIVPGDEMMEGPFGEASGYSEPRMLPVVRVKAVYHRDNPMLTGRMPIYHPPGKTASGQDVNSAATVWDQLERAGVREIKGVACYFDVHIIVIAIRNSYAGHSRQAGIIASQCHRGAYLGNWVIVVDEDIDPSNLTEVMWRVSTATDGSRAIQILDYCWASHLSLLDPTRAFTRAEYPVHPHKATYRSAVVVDACRPVELDRRWHRMVKPSDSLIRRVNEKYGQAMFPEGEKPGPYVTTALFVPGEGDTAV
ncbi:MAG: UbiD family decarboxylase [Chloroflexi bacterium]|nr:UbiD family decarboxylase [Chloroflexota bacterium]